MSALEGVSGQNNRLVGSHSWAYSADGHFLAVLNKSDEGLWHPENVVRRLGGETVELRPSPSCSG